MAPSAQRSVVCIGWCSHGACWHSIAPRSESLEVAAAHVHQSNLCNHTTTHFKHTLITTLSPLALVADGISPGAGGTSPRSRREVRRHDNTKSVAIKGALCVSAVTSQHQHNEWCLLMAE